MGQGRNAVFLASKGWAVTGFDYSAEGIAAARRAAGKAASLLTRRSAATKTSISAARDGT